MFHRLHKYRLGAPWIHPFPNSQTALVYASHHPYLDITRAFTQEEHLLCRSCVGFSSLLPLPYLAIVIDTLMIHGEPPLMRSTSQFPRYITKLIPLFQLIITMYHMRSDFRRWNNLPILSTGLPFVVLKSIDRCTIRLHSPVSFFILSVRSSVLMRSQVGF